MKNFLRQYKLTVWTLVLVLLIGLTGWFGVFPLYKKIFALRDEIQQEIVHQQNQAEQIKRLPELKNQYESVLREESYFDILLTEDKVVSFIRTLEGVANESDVEVKIQSNDTELETQTKKKASNKDDTTNGDTTTENNDEKKPKLLTDLLPFSHYLRLTLTLKGDYTALGTFLSRLESLPVSLDVISVEIRQPVREDNSQDGDVRAVNPFSATDSANPTKGSDTPLKDGTLPVELTQPLSPKLEMVVDLLVYVDKTK